MSPVSRLEFALAQLAKDDWRIFERFCGKFFSDEYPDLRSIGGVGDKGRDALLFSPETEPEIVFQYSLAEDFARKVRDTVDRLAEARVPCRVLIYATNRLIGPRADELKRELLKRAIALDVRDQRYFVDRANRSRMTRDASDELSAHIVDPLLPAQQGLVRNSALSEPDQRAALLYLELQLHDAHSRQGLTRLCVEGLTLARLAQAEPGSFVPIGEVAAFVQTQFSAGSPNRVRDAVAGSLGRLKSRDRVTYQKASESYALHHQERQRLTSRVSSFGEERLEVRFAIADRLSAASKVLGLPQESASRALIFEPNGGDLG